MAKGRKLSILRTTGVSGTINFAKNGTIIKEESPLESVIKSSYCSIDKENWIVVDDRFSFSNLGNDFQATNLHVPTNCIVRVTRVYTYEPQRGIRLEPQPNSVQSYQHATRTVRNGFFCVR